MTNGSHSRRDVRHRVRIPVALFVGKRSLPTFSGDVSLRGLFVHTDSPPALRQLVRVEPLLPDGTKLSLNAMVVFVLPASNPHRRPPGVGLQLYGAGGESEATWHAFVRSVAASQPSTGTTVQIEAVATDPVRRKHPRLAVRLRVLPKNLEALIEMWTRDVSRGGMFIETEQALAEGQVLEVDVVHPDTHATFALSCVVRRIARGSAGRGVGVELNDLDDDRRNAFQEFAMSTIPELEDPLLLVIEDDPALA